MIYNKKNVLPRTQITRNPDHFGKSIEEEIRQAVASKSPIESSAEVVYTPLKDGVLPQYNIRADRQEIALDLTDKYGKSKLLHQDEAVEEPTNVEDKNENVEPTKQE